MVMAMEMEKKDNIERKYRQGRIAQYCMVDIRRRVHSGQCCCCYYFPMRKSFLAFSKSVNS